MISIWARRTLMSCWFHAGQEEHWWVDDINLDKKNTDELLILIQARRTLMSWWFYSVQEENWWVADFILGKKSTNELLNSIQARRGLVSPSNYNPDEKDTDELLISFWERRTLMSFWFQSVQVGHWFVVDFNPRRWAVVSLPYFNTGKRSADEFFISIQASWSLMGCQFRSGLVKHLWVVDFNPGK